MPLVYHSYKKWLINILEHIEDSSRDEKGEENTREPTSKSKWEEGGLGIEEGIYRVHGRNFVKEFHSKDWPWEGGEKVLSSCLINMPHLP